MLFFMYINDFLSILAQHDVNVKLFAGDIMLNVTRSSADADKPARRVWRSVKVTKHSTIPYAR